MTSQVPEAYRLHSLNHTLDVLEVLERYGPELGVTAISRHIGLSKGATHRILINLQSRGYVQQHASGNSYRLGLRLWELGVSVGNRLDVRAAAATFLQELAEATGENTHLAIYDRGEVVYIDKISGPQAVQTYSRVGGRLPAYAVATGKVLLAYQPDAEVQALIQRGLQRHTKHTLTVEALLGQLATIRLQGYAVNIGEWRADVCGIAAPLRDATGYVIAAININAPAYRLSDSVVRRYVPILLASAAEISRQLGYSSIS